MQQVYRLKEVFDNICASNEYPTLVRMLPTPTQYTLMEGLLPFLQMIKGYSEAWSAEKRPMAHTIISDMFELLENVKAHVREMVAVNQVEVVR